MKTRQSSKLSEGSDTASGHNVFLKARLKLTAVYVLIVAAIVFGFSLFLYQSVGRNLRDASDDEFAGAQSHQQLVDDTLGMIGSDLVLADILILLAAAGISFGLAGKTLEPILRSVEAQKAFAANASHELRTPLAVVRSDIEVFLRNPSQSQRLAHDTMKSNLEEIRRMSGMVEDLLLLARSDNQIIPERARIDLGGVAEDTALRMKSLAQSRKISLVSGRSGEAFVSGARGSLERIILNLLQNSIDHTPEGGSVSVMTRREDDSAVVEVKDTGSGIPEKDLPHILKRFYKGESAKGTGLGLSIVKELVGQHGGNISIESAPGDGTAVRVRFPLA